MNSSKDGMPNFSLAPRPQRYMDDRTYGGYNHYTRRRSCIFSTLASGAMRVVSSGSTPTSGNRLLPPGSNGYMPNQQRYIDEAPQYANYAYAGQHQSLGASPETHRRNQLMPNEANRRSQVNISHVSGSPSTNTAHASSTPDCYDDDVPPSYQHVVADGRAPRSPHGNSGKE